MIWGVSRLKSFPKPTSSPVIFSAVIQVSEVPLPALWFKRALATMTDFVPAEVRSSIEWQRRVLSNCRPATALPVFEGPRHALCVVDVARPWAGKPMQITSIAQGQQPHSFKLGETTRSVRRPVVCFRSAHAACRAPQQPADAGLPRGTERRLLVLEVGMVGDGLSGIREGANGMLFCNVVKPVAIRPLPTAGSLAAMAQPKKRFWLPAGGVEPEGEAGA